jgi:hypothetical protein
MFLTTWFAKVEFLSGAWELLYLSETFMALIGCCNVIADGTLLLLVGRWPFNCSVRVHAL